MLCTCEYVIKLGGATTTPPERVTCHGASAPSTSFALEGQRHILGPPSIHPSRSIPALVGWILACLIIAARNDRVGRGYVNYARLLAAQKMNIARVRTLLKALRTIEDMARRVMHGAFGSFVAVHGGSRFDLEDNEKKVQVPASFTFWHRFVFNTLTVVANVHPEAACDSAPGACTSPTQI